jgi:hypothetical protein
MNLPWSTKRKSDPAPRESIQPSLRRPPRVECLEDRTLLSGAPVYFALSFNSQTIVAGSAIGVEVEAASVQQSIDQMVSGLVATTANNAAIAFVTLPGQMAVTINTATFALAYGGSTPIVLQFAQTVPSTVGSGFTALQSSWNSYPPITIGRNPSLPVNQVMLALPDRFASAAVNDALLETAISIALHPAQVLGPSSAASASAGSMPRSAVSQPPPGWGTFAVDEVGPEAITAAGYLQAARAAESPTGRAVDVALNSDPRIDFGRLDATPRAEAGAPGVPGSALPAAACSEDDANPLTAPAAPRETPQEPVRLAESMIPTANTASLTGSPVPAVASYAPPGVEWLTRATAGGLVAIFARKVLGTWQIARRRSGRTRARNKNNTPAL